MFYNQFPNFIAPWTSCHVHCIHQWSLKWSIGGSLNLSFCLYTDWCIICIARWGSHGYTQQGPPGPKELSCMSGSKWRWRGDERIARGSCYLLKHHYMYEGPVQKRTGISNIKRKWCHILTSRWVGKLETLLHLSMTPRIYLVLPPLSRDSIDKFSSSNDIHADEKITKLSRDCVMTYLVR